MIVTHADINAQFLYVFDLESMFVETKFLAKIINFALLVVE